MSYAIINAQYVAPDTAFNIKWQGTNTNPNDPDNSISLRIAFYRESDHSYIERPLKWLTWSMSGDMNVSFSTSEYLSAVAVLESLGGSAPYYIQLEYSGWSYNYSIDSAYSGYQLIYTDPTIIKQPVLTLGSSSGASVAMSWSAAEMINGSGCTIYYQYFVGPSSSYSDSYHIGTTTGLSHTMTEAEIISKCGNGFGASSSGSVCYLFVRAYWQKGSATGGWSTPTGVAFRYYPTINAPADFSLSPTKGKTTSASWTNRLAGNNSQPQSILRRKSGGSWVNIATGISSVYAVPESIWKALGKGSYELCIAHEWYGRYANSGSIIFQYAPENTVRIDGDDCVAYLWDENANGWVACDPYIWNEGSMEWVLCTTT